MKNPTRAIVWTCAMACLLAGVGIYAFFRSHILFLSVLGWEGHAVSTAGRPGLEMMVYNLPDALWYMALLLVQNAYTDRGDRLSRWMFRLSVSFPFVLEGLQAIGWLPGTADVLDLAAYALTLILFITIQLIFMKNKHFILALQAVVLLAFGAMALACASTSTVSVPLTERAESTSVDSHPGKYVYIGTFDSESAARAASQELGYNDYRFENGKAYVKIK